MELKTTWGTIIFALDTAKTVAGLVAAAIAAKKSLCGANLSGANLSRANLSWANLSGADLFWADLSGAGLSGADLSGANLSRANLSWANLSGADLSGANLCGANLSRVNLSGANLSGANLSRANLSWANLSGADLSGAGLYGADLSGAKAPAIALARLQFIPTEGAFIGWKKCAGNAIAKLAIPANAKRSHGTERKCRCSRAKVLMIWRADGTEAKEARSSYDGRFIYRVGKFVEPTNGFDENRWNTCGGGIHFYITREEAEAH